MNPVTINNISKQVQTGANSSENLNSPIEILDKISLLIYIALYDIDNTLVLIW